MSYSLEQTALILDAVRAAQLGTTFGESMSRAAAALRSLVPYSTMMLALLEGPDLQPALVWTTPPDGKLPTGPARPARPRGWWLLEGVRGGPDDRRLAYSIQRAPGWPRFNGQEVALSGLVLQGMAEAAARAPWTRAAPWDLGPDAPESGVVVLTPAGEIVRADEGARTILAMSGGAVDVLTLLRGTLRQRHAPRAGWTRERHLRFAGHTWRLVAVAPSLASQIAVVIHRLRPGTRALLEATCEAAGFSPSERTVAREVSKGRSDKEIARLLETSPDAVRALLTAAMRKVRAKSRAALVARLLGAPEQAGSGSCDDSSS